MRKTVFRGTHQAARAIWPVKPLALAISLASAGAGAETISGRISEADTGASIEGATISIPELGADEVSGAGGSYRFTEIEPGTYTLRVRYSGLKLTEETVRVEAGSDVALDIALADSDASALEEVVVYGQVIERGQARAINDQRASRAIETVISKDLFGQINDGNIANAMQRMPGLSADGNGGDEIPRYINIRGVSASLNSVQVDGSRLPTSGTGRGNAYGNTGRGFALDDLPADAIEKIEIIKAPTPDMDGDGLGGTVNLVTKSALDYGERRFEYKVGGNYNDLREDTFGSAAGTYMDTFEFGAGRQLGISLTASYYETQEGFDNRDVDYNPLRPGDAINSGLGVAQTLQQIGPLKPALQNVGDQQPVALFFVEDTEFNNNVIDRERIGFSGNFDLEWSERTSFALKTVYNTEDQFVDDFRYHKIGDNDHGDNCRETFDPANPQSCFLSRRIIDGPAPGDPVRLGSDPQFRSTIDSVSGDANGFLSGRTTLDADGNPRGAVQYDGQTNQRDIELWSISFSGDHQFDRATLSGGINVSRAEKSDLELDGEFEREGFAFAYDNLDPFTSVNSDYRVINSEFSYIPNADPFEMVIDENRPDTIAPDDYQSEFVDTSEDRLSIKVDYEQQLPEMQFVTGSWKVGMKYATMEKDTDYEEVQYDLAAPGDAGYLLVPWADLVKENPFGPVDQQRMPFTADMAALNAFVNDPANASNGSFEIDELGSLEDSLEQDFTYEEDVWAAYAMASFEAGPVEFIAGLRWEYTDTSVQRNVFNDLNDNGFDLADVSVVNEDRDYHQLLPALHLKWEVMDDLLLRFASTKTYARPSVLDLVNVRRVEEEDDPVEIDEGNFSLPALESQNTDLVLEYYPPEGLWSVGLFRKDMENFSFPSTIIIENVPEFGGRQVQIKTPQATGEAINQGVELSVFQRLYFLPGALNGFFVNANYTWTDSDAEYPGRENETLPTRGASEELIFASVGYEQWGFSGEVQYRSRSPFIEGLAFVDAQGANDFTEDDIFGATETWNVNFSYEVSKGMTVYLNGTNIFNETNASRQGFTPYPEDVYYNERRIAFGVKGVF